MNKEDVYKGHLVSKKFSFNEIDIKWLTKNNHYYIDSQPFIILEFNNYLYYGIGDYKFKEFENYDDWDASSLPDNYFDYWYVSRKEDYDLVLSKTDFTFYKFDYEETMKSDIDEFCQFEIDIIEKWHTKYKRNKIINSIIKKET